MELVLEGNNECLLIRVIGEVVAETCSDLRSTVMETIPRQPKQVVLEMSGVPFLDTSGIGVLVGLRAHLKSKNIQLVLSKPSEKVRQVLKMTRLLAVFGVDEEQ